MAIKKVGQDRRKARKVTCHNCGAILRYYPKDVQTEALSNMCEIEILSWVVCPVCKAHITVK